jgi:TPR repeat protein
MMTASALKLKREARQNHYQTLVETAVPSIPVETYVRQAVEALTDCDYVDAIACCSSAVIANATCIPAILIAQALYNSTPNAFSPHTPHPVPYYQKEFLAPHVSEWESSVKLTEPAANLTMGELLLATLWCKHVCEDAGRTRPLATYGLCTFGHPLFMVELGATGNTIHYASLIERAAILGHARAMYLMGALQRYLRSLPVTNPAAPITDVKWYEKAARYHFPPALVTVGMQHINGTDGQFKNVNLGIKYLEKAQELPEATRILGLCECTGVGMPRNVTHGILRLNLAHHFGDPEAAMILAELYYCKLDEADRDVSRALKWYERAFALTKEPHAAFMLAELYYRMSNGKVTMLTKSFEMLKKAAHAGYASAMALKGAFYGRGLSVPVSTSKAHKWLQKAADASHRAYADMLLWTAHWFDTATPIADADPSVTIGFQSPSATLGASIAESVNTTATNSPVAEAMQISSTTSSI